MAKDAKGHGSDARGGAAHQQGVEDALMASHYQGLQKWVRDYQAMRQSG